MWVLFCCRAATRQVGRELLATKCGERGACSASRYVAQLVVDLQRCCGGREVFSTVSILASGSKPGVRSNSGRIDSIIQEVGRGFHMSLCMADERKWSRFIIRTVGSLSVVKEP